MLRVESQIIMAIGDYETHPPNRHQIDREALSGSGVAVLLLPSSLFLLCIAFLAIHAQSRVMSIPSSPLRLTYPSAKSSRRSSTLHGRCSLRILCVRRSRQPILLHSLLVSATTHSSLSRRLFTSENFTPATASPKPMSLPTESQLQGVRFHSPSSAKINAFLPFLPPLGLCTELTRALKPPSPNSNGKKKKKKKKLA